MCPKGAGRSFNVEKCVQKVQAEVKWREMCPKGAGRSFNVEKCVQKVQAEVLMQRNMSKRCRQKF